MRAIITGVMLLTIAFLGVLWWNPSEDAPVLDSALSDGRVADPSDESPATLPPITTAPFLPSADI